MNLLIAVLVVFNGAPVFADEAPVNDYNVAKGLFLSTVMSESTLSRYTIDEITFQHNRPGVTQADGSIKYFIVGRPHDRTNQVAFGCGAFVTVKDGKAINILKHEADRPYCSYLD